MKQFNSTMKILAVSFVVYAWVIHAASGLTVSEVTAWRNQLFYNVHNVTSLPKMDFWGSSVVTFKDTAYTVLTGNSYIKDGLIAMATHGKDIFLYLNSGHN